MNHVKSIPCIIPGCKFLAADDIRCSGMCGECFRKDCEAGIEDALAMGENMQLHGCIDVPKVVTEAIQWVKDMRAFKSERVYEDAAAACTGRVCVMLGLYGASAESILAVIHKQGHSEVTVSDVKAVMNFIMEGL